jgi:hypothetical protein
MYVSLIRLATSAKSKGLSDFVVEGKNAIGFTSPSIAHGKISQIAPASVRHR